MSGFAVMMPAMTAIHSDVATEMDQYCITCLSAEVLFLFGRKSRSDRCHKIGGLARANYREQGFRRIFAGQLEVIKLAITEREVFLSLVVWWETKRLANKTCELTNKTHGYLDVVRHAFVSIKMTPAAKKVKEIPLGLTKIAALTYADQQLTERRGFSLDPCRSC